MSDGVSELTVAESDAPLLSRLSMLDRFLPVWIIAAMGVGIGLGRAIPSLAHDLNRSDSAPSVSRSRSGCC